MRYRWRWRSIAGLSSNHGAVRSVLGLILSADCPQERIDRFTANCIVRCVQLMMAVFVVTSTVRRESRVMDSRAHLL